MPRASALPQLKLCKHSRGCCGLATSWDGFCVAHAGYRALKSYNARPKPSRSTKNPIGVELEMFNPISIYHLTPVARFVCSDGSLPANGGEVKLCKPLDKIADAAADVAQRARIAGAKVNKKCGFHVHLSLPGTYSENYELQANKWQRVAKFALGIQDMLFDIMPPSRQKNNHFVQKIDDAHDLHNHYSWLSLSSRVPTIEIRLHGGTVNPWKVKGWIEFCIHFRTVIHNIMNDVQGEKRVVENTLEAIKTPKDFCPRNSLSYKYIEARESSPSLDKFVF